MAKILQSTPAVAQMIHFIKVDGHSEDEISASLKTAKKQIDKLAGEQNLVAPAR